jgi:hypothetical protein
MRVTFDTNVWNRMVLPERWPSTANRDALVKIKEAGRVGRIEGFICESFATTEAIRPGERAAYRANNIPIINTEYKSVGPNLMHMAIQIETNHSLHPGLTKEFEEELSEAIAIGIKLLPTSYINVPIPDRLRKNLHIYAPGIFATADYNERFGEIVRTINDRGVGNGTLVALGNEIKAAFAAVDKKVGIGDRELIKRVYDAVRAAGDKKIWRGSKRLSRKMQTETWWLRISLSATPISAPRIMESRRSVLRSWTRTIGLGLRRLTASSS